MSGVEPEILRLWQAPRFGKAKGVLCPSHPTTYMLYHIYGLLTYPKALAKATATSPATRVPQKGFSSLSHQAEYCKERGQGLGAGNSCCLLLWALKIEVRARPLLILCWQGLVKAWPVPREGRLPWSRLTGHVLRGSKSLNPCLRHPPASYENVRMRSWA